MELLIILLLTLLNGIFSMSEIALVSARKSRLEVAANNGDKSARAALELARSPNRFLSTVQIGITLIGILLGIFSGQNLTDNVQSILNQIPLLQPYSHSIAVVAMLFVITYLSLVLGELVPKQIGLRYPETIAKLVVTPMSWLSRLTSPFIWLLTVSSDALIKLLGISSAQEQVTEDEIKSVVREGASGGAIDAIEEDIVQNVFSLGDRRIASLMTHRADIDWLNALSSEEEIRAEITTSHHSVYPLCHGSLDTVLGLLHVKDYWSAKQTNPNADLRALTRRGLTVHENTRAYPVLEKFKESRIHMAVVVDEYGNVVGVVTINDILDALIGEFSQEEDDKELVKQPDGTYLADAQWPFDEFVRQFNITPSDRGSYANFNSIGGFALQILEDIPVAGQAFEWHGFQFKIISMDRNRIDKILIRPLGR
ncbi:hemolysin family protein [Spirosoma terrae]|uniref:HlyC/CorC family transporter n=1 Tax=Spirosoma terrae TaxID=1968276 RepID=A0A6L9L9T2_9BACT|nr:hemolysin family protein [Spirosoma terrae]NDU97306.1 HlyC/CorC family transporter [Spirosoma terrae]